MSILPELGSYLTINLPIGVPSMSAGLLWRRRRQLPDPRDHAVGVWLGPRAAGQVEPLVLR